jgi:tRNA(Leu) C34 or U34 (ribose-2'-O)-methylase TrmL
MIAIQGQRFKKCCTDTQSAWRHIPLIETDDLFESIPYSCIPVAVEIVEGARSLERYQHPERAFYILGPEDGSIPKAILNRCRDVVSVPTKYCMNLAATANVILYDRVAKAMRSGERN